MQKATFLTSVSASGATNGQPSVMISTADVDRDGDTLDPQGCDLANYRRCPTVLYGHDYASIPVGAATAVDITPDVVHASWRWLENDAFAQRVENAWSQGILRAASVGFRPLEWEPRTDGNGKHYTRW